MQPLPRRQPAKAFTHLILGLAIAACMYLPDALYGLANRQYSTHLSLMDGVALWLASLLLLAIPSQAVAYVTMALIALLQLGPLLYFSYFGTHAHPQALGLLPSELHEIGLTLSSFIQHLWIPLGLVLTSTLINAWLWPMEGLPRHDYTVNSYDNAIRHTDALLDGILHQLRERSRLPAYFVFTADHGELLGEHGHYGHTLLEPDIARVPFLFYATDEQSQWLQAARQMEEPSHYEIGLLLARMLGFRIDNPNDDGRTVFVSGADLGGGMGWMEVERRPGGAFTESQVQVKTP